MHDGGKQMREKAVSRSREHSKDVALCGLFAALVAVGAFIKVVIPTGADTMNFTLQWFFVMLAAFLLGSRRAFTSVGVYLLIGLAGVPIFARGGGPAYLLRPTFGFLLGFLLAAWVMGKVCECLNSWKMGALMMAATAGYVVYYGMGMVYFYLITHLVTLQPIGWKAIVLVYCLPEMPADYILCILAAIMARRLRPMVQAYLLDSARDEMIAENAAIALVYSGEAPYATEYNDDLAYVVPKEGSNVWVDSWAVTKDCKNTENAEKFLNYLLRVDISKISFEYNHYGTPNKKLAEILPAKYTEDPALFPPSDVLDNCEIFRSLDRGTQDYYSKLWKEIKLD